MAGGLVSAAQIAVVADFGPMPNPRAKRATNMLHQEFVNACQKQAIAEKRQLMKRVPRRPKTLLNGTVSQHPMKAQHRYGAELTRPVSQT